MAAMERLFIALIFLSCFTVSYTHVALRPASESILLALSETARTLPAVAVAPYKLQNDYVAVSYDPASAFINEFSFGALPPFTFDPDVFTLTVTSSLTTYVCQQFISATLTSSDIFTAVYACDGVSPSQANLTIDYSLCSSCTFLTIKPTWNIETRIDNTTVQSVLISLSTTSPVGAFDIIDNINRHDHVTFMRRNRTVGSMGIFVAAANPFTDHSIDNESGVTTLSMQTLNIGVALTDDYGIAFTTDLYIIGAYAMSAYWHLTTINYNERRTFSQCISYFAHKGRSKLTSSLKLAVGWDSNEYQLDLSTSEGMTQWTRLIDRASEIGITHFLTAPQNSATSSRSNATDDWGWEEKLFLTLGESIRQQTFIPCEQALPISIQSHIQYAASKNIRLVTPVYPPLGFLDPPNDSKWLYSCSNNRKCASLSSIEFQHYLLNLLIHFYKCTNISGYAFDYNSFLDPHHSIYSQWRGWQYILAQLRLTFPDIVIDHRQNAHMYGPWSWVSLTYTEPIRSDENPETYTIPYTGSAHTDHVSADVQRASTLYYLINDLCPMSLIPAFIGHQTERNYNNGSISWSSSHYIRDFDLLGFEYNLLSSVATAGLNMAHTLLPARDIEEYTYLPEYIIKFWKTWLLWTDQHLEMINNTIPIILTGINDDGVRSYDGWSLVDDAGQNGFIFIFVAEYPQRVVNITIDESTQFVQSLNNTTDPLLSSSTYYIVSEVYPESRHIALLSYGESVPVSVDGTSAAVYNIRSYNSLSDVDWPVIIGVTGDVTFADVQTLLLINVIGEAGTQHIVSVLCRTSAEAARINFISINGIKVDAFTVNNRVITVIKPLTFPSQYIPHSMRIGDVPPATFAGGVYNGTLTVSNELINELNERRRIYPIEWTDDELSVSWLSPHRPIIFISLKQAALAKEQSFIATVNGQSVIVRPAYNTRHRVDGRLLGYFLDMAEASPLTNITYIITVTLPSIPADSFIGLFLENHRRIILPSATS